MAYSPQQQLTLAGAAAIAEEKENSCEDDDDDENAEQTDRRGPGRTPEGEATLAGTIIASSYAAAAS